MSGPKIIKIVNKTVLCCNAEDFQPIMNLDETDEMLAALGGGADGARKNTGLSKALNSSCQGL